MSLNRSLAQALSYLLHPAVYPVLGVLLILKISPYHITSKVMLLSLALVFVGTYIIPMALSYWLHRMGWIENLEMRRARDRRLPYLIGAMSYYLVAALMRHLQLPIEAYLYLIASTLVIVMHLFLLNVSKPSAHLAGLGGFTGLLFALSLSFSINLLPLLIVVFLLTGMLASARLYLQAHNYLELVVGYFSGLATVFVVVYWVG